MEKYARYDLGMSDDSTRKHDIYDAAFPDEGGSVNGSRLRPKSTIMQTCEQHCFYIMPA